MGKSKKKSLRYYYGIPHAHTDFSTGRGTPLEAYEYGKNNGLNFLALTDHNSYLNNETSINNNHVSKWIAMNYARDKFSKKSASLIPLVGFETRTALYGDFNIINCDTFFTGTVRNLNALALWMINNPDSFITINHPHKNVLSLTYNELINKLITSIEVGNGSFPHKYSRYEKYYYSLLDKGWKLGAINGQDNHRINFGDSDNLTVVLATELSSEKIIDAFRKRRTFSTESRNLKMYFTINNILMGDILKIDKKKLKFMIYAEDPKNKIKQIEIITNKGVLVKKIDNINLNSIKYLYEHEKEEGENWYIIKIHQEGNRIAISSPIFLDYKL
ncbi:MULTISPECIES: CehA/McbA family metallohydrolase [Clostridium]|uniref:CehA/McbA family metallohydrolase n=1 Tax=Clostridium TaxID=1485 RepID=UPI001A9B8493|nr:MULTISPECIES: CehA/McbA family metallohydrolase [Clostridium]